MDGLDQKTKGTLELLDDGLDERGEAQVWVLAVDVLCELGNSLGVGLCLELEALALEQNLEFLVICDDAIVDDGELPVGVGPGKSKLEDITAVVVVVVVICGWGEGDSRSVWGTRVPAVATWQRHNMGRTYGDGS